MNNNDLLKISELITKSSKITAEDVDEVIGGGLGSLVGGFGGGALGESMGHPLIGMAAGATLGSKGGSELVRYLNRLNKKKKK